MYRIRWTGALGEAVQRVFLHDHMRLNRCGGDYRDPGGSCQGCTPCLCTQILYLPQAVSQNCKELHYQQPLSLHSSHNLCGISMQWLMVFKYIEATGKETMRSDLTSTSHCLFGSVKACWVHMFTLLILCVLLKKWWLVTSKHSCLDRECYTFKVSSCPFKKCILRGEIINTHTQIFIMLRICISYLLVLLTLNYILILGAIYLSLIHGSSAKRGRWWYWHQLLRLSGTSELPRLC